jgi:hypothetical protein
MNSPAAILSDSEHDILDGYSEWPMRKTGSGISFVDVSDEFTTWLGFANAGMLNKGNLLCFDYALSHLPGAGAVVEIGSFCGLSTNLISYYKRRHGVTNPLFNCDRWIFEGAGGMVGDSTISHDQYRAFVMDTYRRNVSMFSGRDLPHTLECFSDEFFQAWEAGGKNVDLFGRTTEVGGPISFCYIDGNHTYEQARRDFVNTDQFLTPGGFILFDDSADGSIWEVTLVIDDVKRMPN